MEVLVIERVARPDRELTLEPDIDAASSCGSRTPDAGMTAVMRSG